MYSPFPQWVIQSTTTEFDRKHQGHALRNVGVAVVLLWEPKNDLIEHQ